jgi:hypothetical protein
MKNMKTYTLQQGVRFDPDMPQTIRLEFAKSNTKGKTRKSIKHPPSPLNIKLQAEGGEKSKQKLNKLCKI